LQSGELSLHSIVLMRNAESLFIITRCMCDFRCYMRCKNTTPNHYAVNSNFRLVNAMTKPRDWAR
jgi:hypothetical protein